MSKQNIVDLTKTGPLSFRELRELNSLDRTPEAAAVLSSPSGEANALRGMGRVNYTQPEVYDDFGSSSYDAELANYDLLVNRGDIRAASQSWLALIGAGVAKGAILAGTTFLDGTIGLVIGGVEALNRGDWSGLWDNDFSRAMLLVNEWSEEALPNYYSEHLSWLDEIGNYIGDMFIKNLGFSIGSMYSGGVANALFKSMKLPQLIGAITNSTKAPAMVSTVLGSTISAVNEGRIEAINNSKDWQDLKIRELDDKWRERIDAKYTQELQSIRDEYLLALKEYQTTGNAERYLAKINALDARSASVRNRMDAEWENRDSDKTYMTVKGKIAEDRLRMGNADLLFNLPILLASNMTTLAKFYSNGFNTARKAGVKAVWNTAEDTGERTVKFIGKKFNKGKGILKTAKGLLSEGAEELEQSAVSAVSGNYYSTDVDNFYKSLIDPDAELETLDWMKSFSYGINETVNNKDSWGEFLIGALTGFMGIPSFRSMKGKDGKFRSPITLEGGAYNSMKEYKEEVARSLELADLLNKRVQSPEFLNYYRGFIRHKKYQNDMNEAVDENDEFNFKNAEHALFVSDIIMFDNAGRLGELETLINAAYDTSDENLESIVKNTTSTDESGRKIGPFIDKNGNPLYDTEAGKQLMIEKLTLTKDSIRNAIDNYRKTKNDLDIRTGGSLSDEQLSELTWIKTQIDDWRLRADDMTPLVKKTLINLRDNIYAGLLKKIGDASMEGEEAIEKAGEAADKLGIGADRLKLLENLASMSNEDLTRILTSPKNEKFVEGLIALVAVFGSDIISALDKQTVIKLLQDLPKVGKGIELYNSKLEEYLADPSKLEQDKAKAKQLQEEKGKALNNLKAKDRVGQSAVSDLTKLDDDELSELEGLLDEEDSEEAEKLALAKDLKKTKTQIADTLHKQVQLGELSPEEEADALALLEANAQGANSLDELEDLDSEDILLTEPDTSELEQVLKEATENGTKSVSEALEELRQEKERRKDAARTALAKGINIVREERKKAALLPKGEPEKFEPKGSGKEEVSGSAIPVSPSTKSKSSDDKLTEYINKLINKGLTAREIKKALKRTKLYKNLIQSGITDQLIDAIILNEINKATNKGGKTPSVISVDSSELDLEDENSFDSSSFDLDKAIDDSNNSSYDSLEALAPVNGKYNYWKPATSEFKRGRLRGDNSPYHDSPRIDSRKRSRYKAVWDFLKSKFAFERVKLVKTGDKVYFGISKKLTLDAGVPVLLMFNDKGEVIGDLPVPDDISFNRLNGFEDTYKEAVAYYYNNKDSSSDDIVMIPNLRSTVNGKFIGKPQYTALDERRTLNLINTVEAADGSKKQVPFKLGVAVLPGPNARIMVTPGRRERLRQTNEELAVLKPLTSTLGQPFMLMKTSKRRPGTNNNVTVCVPITMPKFSMSNSLVANSRLGNIILKKIEELTTINGNKDSILKWIKEVKELLAIYKLHVDITPGSLGPNGRGPERLTITILKYGGAREVIFNGPKNSPNLVQSVLDALSKDGGTLINVSRKYINGSYKGADYNSMIGELATTNLPEGAIHTINDWFTINPIVGGKEDKGEIPKTLGENPNSSQGMFLYTVNGVTYGLGDNNRLYREDNGKYIDISDLATMEFKAYMYGVKYNFNMSKPFSTPWGYYNPLTLKFESLDILGMLSRKTELSNSLSSLSSRIVFNPEDHTYTIDGKKADISVTQWVHKDDKKDKEKDPVLGFLEISSILGNSIHEVAAQFFNGDKVVKPKNMTDKLFASLISSFMKLKDQITTVMGDGWVAITDENLLRVAGTIDGLTIAGTIDMLVMGKDGTMRIIDFKTKRIDDNGHFSIEGRTRELYEQQVLIYNKLFGDMNPLFKGKLKTPILAAFSVLYPRPKGSRRYETGEAVYTEDNGAILLNGKPILDSTKYNPGEYRELKEARNSTAIPTVTGLSPKGIKPESPKLPAKAGSKKALKSIKSREESFLDLEDKGIISSSKPEVRAMLEVLDDANLSVISSKPKTLLKTIIKKALAEYRLGMTQEEIVTIMFGRPLFRKQEAGEKSDHLTWDKEVEVKRATLMLPLLGEDGVIRLIDGLIKISDSTNPGYAWGMFMNGRITLSDIAARGTLYHEAFHFVSQALMSKSERDRVYRAARRKYGNKSNEELEELIAEDFRKFTLGIEQEEVQKMNFFQRIFAAIRDFIRSTLGKEIELEQLFREINRGRYARRKVKVSTDTLYKESEYTEEMKSIKSKAIANGTFMKAPNDKPTNLNERQWLQVRTKAFKRWFGDWEKVANITEEELQSASLIFDRVPELAKIGTPAEYAAYIKEIFPNSVEKGVYWHGSNEDFSEGFASAKRGEGSGALETKKRNDLYLNKQGWASLQYVNGINRKGRDKNGFAHWNKLWWELKEIISNGRRENNDWKDIVIDESTIRQAIPNKKGVFNRDSGGKNGKWLSERKADYGYENKSDKEFFEEIFGIKLGKDTFNTWTARNAEIFKSLEKSAKGINPVVIDVRNPIIEEGQNTYYEEQRGLFTIANAKGNDAILSKKADNEFNSDVAVVINANNDNVYWLGTKSDIERFRQWKINNDASKVVDENGEPLVVYHGSKSIFNIFDSSKSESRQYLSQQIKPTNFFSSDKTIADFFALTENQSLASQISKSIHIVLDAFAGENIDEDTLDDKVWTYAASRTGKSKEFVKDFWENKVPEEYKKYDEFGTTRMEDPDINKYKYNVFLNMKSPIILDAKGERADRFIEANKEVLNNNDEVIIININETVGKEDTATDYLVRNPNQIKSATSNTGEFSTTNDDIRYRRISTEISETELLIESYKLDRDSVEKRFDEFKKDPRTKKFLGNIRMFTSARYLFESEALLEIPPKYRDFLTVVEDRGRYIIVYEKGFIEEVISSINTLISELEQQLKELEYLADSNLLADYEELEQLDFGSIRLYHRQKLDYINLPQERKQYLELRGISVLEYSKMSEIEKEVLFECMA